MRDNMLALWVGFAAFPLMVVVAAAQDQERPPKITLTPEMVFNEVGEGDASLLVDEQEIAGDPRAGRGGHPTTTWYLKQRPVYYPMVAFIDLGKVHQLSDVYLYDLNGMMDLHVEVGEPFNWKPLLTDGLKAYKSWNAHPVDVQTRYVRVIANGQGGAMPEIVLYGRPVEGAADATPPRRQAPAVKRQRATADEIIGTNAFIDDPLEHMKVVNYIREYHDLSWDLNRSPAYPDTQLALNPSYAGGGGWYFDDYYRKLKDAGITVAPAIKGSVQWLTENRAHRPVKAGDDREDPASYRVTADHMFQFVARYGSRKIADEKLKLAPDQPRVSGLGLIQYYENGNEPDGWWHGREGYARPFEFAAQSSADYDGHQGKLGEGYGLKNADPNAKLVMGGLAGLDLGYVKAMKLWADWNRGGSFPADAINLHTYSNDLGGQGDSRRGVSPEDDRLREKLEAVVAWRDEHLPDKELWLTEFGYDTHPGSVQGAPAIGDHDTEEVQGRWLLRSYLAILASGVDRGAQYMLRDAGTGPTKYSTSGFTTGKGEWQRKSSWYYTHALKERLKGMRFDGDVASGNDDVWIYRFRHDDGRGAYVLWCPTTRDLSVAGYALEGLAPAKSATLVEFAKGEELGVTKELAIDGGAVKVTVSERPVILLVDALPQQ